MWKAVAYLRVSTVRQGRSGLGLEAQRETVARLASSEGWRVLEEFVEVESGRRSDRAELARALALCRVHAATLAVAKVDRLTRSVGFLYRVLGAGVDVRFCDLPALEGPTGRFMLNQMVAVAELEAGLISQRTKAALAAAKARGVSLGSDRGHVRQDPRHARAALARKADSRAGDLLPVVEGIRGGGVVSLSGIARELTRRGSPPRPDGRSGGTNRSPISLPAYRLPNSAVREQKSFPFVEYPASQLAGMTACWLRNPPSSVVRVGSAPSSIG